jgi:hypothetical protein
MLTGKGKKKNLKKKKKKERLCQESLHIMARSKENNGFAEDVWHLYCRLTGTAGRRRGLSAIFVCCANSSQFAVQVIKNTKLYN